jgi:hypothetical protein
VKHQAIILRINRNVAGARFPFDKVYFFKKEAKQHLPRVFSHALVIAPTKPFIEMVSESIASSCKVGKVYPMRRRDEEVMGKVIAEELPIHDVVANYKNYMALIPILFLTNHKKKTQINPAYLYASRKPRPARRPTRNWQGKYTKQSGTKVERSDHNMYRMMHNAFTSRSYFLMEGEKFQPVCIACPNNLLMITDQCRLGSSTCFEKLAQVKPSNFRKNMNRYVKWLKQVGEPEIQLEDDNE